MSLADSVTLKTEDEIEETNSSVLEDGPSDFLSTLAVIQQYPNELYNFEVGNHNPQPQIETLLQYLQMNAWVPCEEDDSVVEFDVEIYNSLLEGLASQMYTHLNLFFQFIYAEKMCPSGPNPFQVALKSSCFWKILVTWFGGVQRDDVKIKPSWDHEVTNSVNLYDYLPPDFQYQMQKYMDKALPSAYSSID